MLEPRSNSSYKYSIKVWLVPQHPSQPIISLPNQGKARLPQQVSSINVGIPQQFLPKNQGRAHSRQIKFSADKLDSKFSISVKTCVRIFSICVRTIYHAYACNGESASQKSRSFFKFRNYHAYAWSSLVKSCVRIFKICVRSESPCVRMVLTSSALAHPSGRYL